ncbi:MAG: HopJ type III effector protein [Methylococcales bacterium]
MTTTQTLHQFIIDVKAIQRVNFDQTMQMIDEHYQFTPIRFENGLDIMIIVNQPGTNSGSCKIFAFARLHGLDEQQTLGLFGDYYHKDVLGNPEGLAHANIRTFMKYGWKGINMPDNPLQLRN